MNETWFLSPEEIQKYTASFSLDYIASWYPKEKSEARKRQEIGVCISISSILSPQPCLALILTLMIQATRAEADVVDRPISR